MSRATIAWARRHPGDRVLPGFSYRCGPAGQLPPPPALSCKKRGENPPRSSKGCPAATGTAPPQSSALAKPRLCRPGAPPCQSSLTALPPCYPRAFAPLPPKNAVRVSRKGDFMNKNERLTAWLPLVAGESCVDRAKHTRHFVPTEPEQRPCSKEMSTPNTTAANRHLVSHYFLDRSRRLH